MRVRSLTFLAATLTAVASAALTLGPPVTASQPAGTVYELQVTGRAGVPNGATAASINLTAVNATNAGHLTAYDCGTRPNASTLNYTPGTTVANSTIIPLSANGTVCIHTHATTDILADITGWYPANTDYTPRTPHRLLDTRNTNTPSAGRTLELQITGRAGVPNGATAASINLTAVNATNAGHLTAYDCGTRPNASTLNYTPGTTVANSTIVPLSANGTVCIHTHATTDILADITGWYPANTDYTPRTPHRLLDTRNTNTPSAGRTLELQITGRAGVPNGATAASINLTAVNATNAGHLTAYDCGTRPNASTLNYTPGTTVANSTIIPLSANGTVCIHTHATTDILADITGWYPANTDYTPRTPHRLLDTRNTNGNGGGNGGGGTGSGTGRFATLPVGAMLPSGAECEARVRPAAETRPENSAANNTGGSRSNANTRSDWSGFARVDGDFTGTTDEIIQWAACKWGIDEDIARAQVIKESYWYQSANGDNGESWGLGQVRDTAHQSAFQYGVNARNSSAYNLDYTYASWRACYEGVYTWLNTVERNGTYSAGDLWGCLGVWFSGRWYVNNDAYLNQPGDSVRWHYENRTWETAQFING